MIENSTLEAAANISDRSESPNRQAAAGIVTEKATSGAPEKLNHLIDLVGELVIASAAANLLANRSGLPALAEANSLVSHLVEGIRDTALQMRMVKIGETFERIRSAAHDVAREAGKEIQVLVTGADTEMDNTVVERIGEPLMRLVRNALDRGIESADTRVAEGKPAKGRIELNAFHDSASIVIEVSDDGVALDKDAIRAEAIRLGLLADDHAQSDEDVLNLIFVPGFAGPANGLDQVKHSLEELRGAVSVSSAPDKGTRFAIRLPLTLAIIDGFLTGVAASSYVIPLAAVVECIELTDASTDGDYINLRGEVLPYVRLRELFDIPGEKPLRENVVVVQYAGQRAGIVVDRLLGEFQTVIKPLGTLFSHIRGIGGSTILGSGEVALILDVQALVGRSAQTQEKVAIEPGGDRRRHEALPV